MKLKKSNFILVVHGEPSSIFLEIFFKSLKRKKFKSPIILISSEEVLKLQMKYFNFKKNIRVLDINDFCTEEILTVDQFSSTEDKFDLIVEKIEINPELKHLGLIKLRNIG